MAEKATLEEIGTEVGDIFGILNALKITGDVNQFQQWLRTYHGAKRLDEHFEGYKFLLKTIVRTFVTHLVYDSALDIEEDFTFYRMNFQGIEIHSVPNTCDKTVLIKNLYESAKPMWKSKSWLQLEKSVKTYLNGSIAILDRIFDKHVDAPVELKTSKADALRYATIFYTMAFLNDTEKGIPHGYFCSILEHRLKQKYIDSAFEGYKYGLQYLWNVLLEGGIEGTAAEDIHTADTWSAPNDFLSQITNPDLPADTQRRDLDSFFGRINDTIVTPLQKELGISRGFSSTLLVKESVSRKEFGWLLEKTPNEPNMNPKELLGYKLFWYDVDILDTSGIHIFNGVPAFIAVMLGNAEMKKTLDLDQKVVVARFLHPDRQVKGNDYSYGVLIEAMGGLGFTDYSGWLLFLDCATDYSGMGGFEHKQAELFINELDRENRVQVREIVIGKKELREFLAKSVVSSKGEAIRTEVGLLGDLRELNNRLAEAKGALLELLLYYYITVEEYEEVEWEFKGVDLVAKNRSSLNFIECKVRLVSDIQKDSKKLRDKADKIMADPDFRKQWGIDDSTSVTHTFCFWERPRSEILKAVHKLGMDTLILSEKWDENRHLRGKKKDRFRLVFSSGRDQFKKRQPPSLSRWEL